jgi:hypothetical protein
LSTSTGAALPSTVGHPVTEKLTKSNYALWKLQVLPAIRGARLVGYIGGSRPAPPEEITTGANCDAKTEPNPAYMEWLALDQQVFSYVVASLTKDVLKQVATCATAAKLWKTLEEMGAS